MAKTDLDNKTMKEMYNDRELLEARIPLAVPLHMNVDPCNRCNYSCYMCPTGNRIAKHVARPSGRMSIALFRKIIAELEPMGTLKSLSLYSDGEPFLNRHTPEMIRIAKTSGRVKTVTVTSNGSLITPEVSRQLVEIGLDMLCISMYAFAQAAYAHITGQKRFDHLDILNNLQHLRQYREARNATKPFIYVKMIEGHRKEDQYRQMKQALSGIADGIGQEYADNWDNSEAIRNSTREHFRVNLDDITYCPKAWYSLNIAFNGDVRICCADWSHATTIGNVSRNALAEIWNGEHMRAFRRMIMDKRHRENPACRNCNFFKKMHFGQAVQADNLDRLIETDPDRALSCCRIPPK